MPNFDIRIMFKNLLDFSYNRKPVEAIGFYIFYLILIMIMGGVVAGLLSLVVENESSFEFGLRMGNIVGIITSLVLSFLILNKKGLLNNPVYLIIALLSGLLAYFFGGLLGLIPPTFLSTRK